MATRTAGKAKYKKPAKRKPKTKQKTKRAQSAGRRTGPVPQMCGLPVVEPPPLPPGLDDMRVLSILLTREKWANGTVLHYHFLDQAAALGPQIAVVRKGFKRWKDLGIGLEFVEVNNPQDAEIRITFDRRLGSWSHIGTACLSVATAKATMNFGWNLTNDFGWATTLHEIGHALGMPHEHQNPKAGIVWDEPKVIATYSGPPNSWDVPKIRHNILRKLPASTISAGSEWDPKSIMHYRIIPGLIKSPAPFDATGTPENLELSQQDVAFAKTFYPSLRRQDTPVLGAMQMSPISDKIGGQVNFRIEPTETRTYTLQTSGEADTRIVLFEQYKGKPVYLCADDDSGQDKNASIRTKLFRGRKYVARIRTNYIRPNVAAAFVVT